MDRLLGPERRETGWMRAETAGDTESWCRQAVFGRTICDADALGDVVQHYLADGETTCCTTWYRQGPQWTHRSAPRRWSTRSSNWTPAAQAKPVKGEKEQEGVAGRCHRGFRPFGGRGGRLNVVLDEARLRGIRRRLEAIAGEEHAWTVRNGWGSYPAGPS